jgi:PilZ domain
MTGPKDWLENFLKHYSQGTERRSSARQSVDQFAAYRWNGSSLKQESVRDISSTGLYILTEERWQPGTLLFLTLQREGPLEMNPEGRIEVQARVARHGEDGVGLAFVLPDDPQSRQWESLRENLIEKAKPEDMRSLVRIAAAVGFLGRICPGGAQEIGQLLGGRLSNDKLANALSIALKVENLLAFELATDRLHADPGLVVRILEDGSCTDEDWLKHFWGGLLATSCAVDGKDESSLVFVELLSQLTTFPVRILTVVCTRATKFMAESGSISAKPLACKIEELMLTTGSRGLQFERDLERLSELGLIEKRDSNSPTLLACDETNITPSTLGLQLFARCNGHRGSLRDFYAADSRQSGSGFLDPRQNRALDQV